MFLLGNHWRKIIFLFLPLNLIFHFLCYWTIYIPPFMPFYHFIWRNLQWHFEPVSRFFFVIWYFSAKLNQFEVISHLLFWYFSNSHWWIVPLHTSGQYTWHTWPAYRKQLLISSVLFYTLVFIFPWILVLGKGQKWS